MLEQWHLGLSAEPERGHPGSLAWVHSICLLALCIEGPWRWCVHWGLNGGDYWAIEEG